MLGNTYESQDCTIARALEVVGERWTLLVLRDALYGVRRFSDFAEHLDIPRAVLSDRLRKLVAAGLLERVTTVGDDASHSGVVYELTEAGRDVWPIVHSLAQWGRRHGTRVHPARAFMHESCGTALDAYAHCPTCGIAPGVEDIISTPTEAGEHRGDRVSTALSRSHRMLQPI